MNILQINQFDTAGGAAISAYRLHEALNQASCTSRLLVDAMRLTDEKISSVKRNRRTEEIVSHAFWKLGLNNLGVGSTFFIPQHPFYQQSDILNFHSLHGQYFNYLAIPYLTHDKPAVFTLHDMWGFTGHCSYSFECEKWISGCGKCPYPQTYPPVNIDLTNLEWALKKLVYQRSRLKIITPSRWLESLAKQSILGMFDIFHIPNGIDTNTYRRLDSTTCRNALGISVNKVVLLFAVQNFGDYRKGGDLLIEAIKCLPELVKKEIVLLLMGEGRISELKECGLEVAHLGYVSGDQLKVVIYSSADYFLFPTRADNFPLVLQESVSCGTPVISFDVGGVHEIVKAGETGLIVPSNDFRAFSQAIETLFLDRSLRQKMSFNCREMAVREYPIDLQASRYIEVYKKMLS